MKGQRYTATEMAAMESAPAMYEEEPAPPVRSTLEAGEKFAGGVAASIQRTILGLKQLGTYVAGNDEARRAVNDQIKALEQEYAPILATPIGKVGEAAGVMGQFAGPGGVAMGAAKMLPRAAAATRAVVGAPGSVGRAATAGGTFEATQPVEPAYTGTKEYLLGKAGRTAMGAAGGAVAGKVAKMITSPGIPTTPERAAVVKEAERLGIKLTPAQRTGDVTLQQFEEGLASRPGSARTIWDMRNAQQDVLNRKAATALGSPAPAPTEAVLSEAAERAATGYEPLAAVKKMSWDSPYIEALDKFVKTQATKATGSANAAGVATRLKKSAGKWTGDDFIEELQGVRDMAFGARQGGDVATAKQLNKLAGIMEDFAERRVAVLAKKGEVVPDAVAQMKRARTEYAKIHAVEKATEPVSGRVSAPKFITQELKGKPARTGRGTSEAAKGLRDVGDTARVLRQTMPYIPTSGTAERIAGQQLVEAAGGLMAAARAAGPIFKNWLAAKYYMAHGGQPGFFGSRLPPGQNMMIRRLLPPGTIAAGEALTE